MIYYNAPARQAYKKAILKDYGDYVTDQEIKGKVKRVKGKIREGLGKLTGNKEERVKGKIEQAEGSVREQYGKAKKKLRKFARDAELR